MSQGEMQRRTDIPARLQDDCEKLGNIVDTTRQSVRPRPVSESDVNSPTERHS